MITQWLHREIKHGEKRKNLPREIFCTEIEKTIFRPPTCPNLEGCIYVKLEEKKEKQFKKRSSKMSHNNATPHRHSLLLLKFSSYSPFGLFSFLPCLLLNFNALPVPTLTYRTFPKLTSLRAALRTSPIPSTDQPTIAFRIIGIDPAPIVPCDPYSPSCHFAWVANVVWSADVAVVVPGDDVLAVSGCSAAGGTIWWVGEGQGGVSSGRRRDRADGYV